MHKTGLLARNRASLRSPGESRVFDVSTDEARRFLKLLDARALVFNFSWYREKGTNTAIQGRLAEVDATYRTAPFDDDFALLLGALNGHQRAIYVCMNVLGANNGSDARTDDNIAKVRAIFADFDDGLPDEPFPLKPTCLVHTSNDLETGAPRYQAFWCVEGVSLEEFDPIEARLVADWRADPNSVNLSRIQRLPGYWHQKHGMPHLVSIVEEQDVTYSRKQILKAFPPMRDGTTARENRAAKLTDPAGPPSIKLKARNHSGISAPQVEVDVGALRSALAHLAATPHPSSKLSRTYSDNYETWMQFGLAIKRSLGDAGFAIWDEWARTCSRYPGIAESRAKWDHGFDIDARSGDDAITVGTIFHCAKRHGWSFTKYKVASSLSQTFNTYRAHGGQK